jgi:hypothetical protein
MVGQSPRGSALTSKGQDVQHDGTTTDEPGYRWVILMAVSVSLAVAMGQLVNGHSVYFIPLEEEFGWTRGDVSLINTIGLLGVAIGGIVVGHVVDRLGMRVVFLCAAVAFGVYVLLAPRATTLWQFHVLFGIPGFVGGGAMFAPLIALAGNWFRNAAGMAIGIASAGQAVGQGGVPFGTTYLIEAMGWRGALVAQGLISLAVLVPLALLLREPPWHRARRCPRTAWQTARRCPTPGRWAWSRWQRCRRARCWGARCRCARGCGRGPAGGWPSAGAAATGPPSNKAASTNWPWPLPSLRCARRPASSSRSAIARTDQLAQVLQRADAGAEQTHRLERQHPDHLATDDAVGPATRLCCSISLDRSL